MSEQIQSLEPELAQVKLGEVLRAHRLSKQTEVSELARTLILSPAQITAIESGTQSSFHNQTFYLRALKKYISYSGLEVDEQTNLFFTQIESALLSHSTKTNPNEVSLLITAGLAHKRKSYLPQFALKKSHSLWIGFAIVIVAGVSIVLFQAGPQNKNEQQSAVSTIAVDQAKTATTQVQSNSGEKLNTPAPFSASTANEATPVKSSESTTVNKQNQDSNQNAISATLKLTFSAPSWVQAVEQNGKRIEKVFTPQDSLELELSTLASLVIGNARETQLQMNTKAIDLNKYLNTGSGVARFSRQELMGLGAQ